MCAGKCFLTFLLAVPGVLSTHFSECDLENGPSKIKIISVNVTGCPDNAGQVCVLRKGTEAIMAVDFEALESLEKMDVAIYGILMGGAELPYPGTYNKDACSNSGLTCPVPQGVPQTYTVSIPVRKSFPRVSVTIRIKFGDAGCFEIPAKVDK